MTAFLSGEMKDTVEIVRPSRGWVPGKNQLTGQNPAATWVLEKVSRTVCPSQYRLTGSSSLARREQSCSDAGREPAPCGSR